MSFEQLRQGFEQYADTSTVPDVEKAVQLIDAFRFYLEAKTRQAAKEQSLPCLDTDERVFVVRCREKLLEHVLAPLIFEPGGKWMGAQVEIREQIQAVLDLSDAVKPRFGLNQPSLDIRDRGTK